MPWRPLPTTHHCTRKSAPAAPLLESLDLSGLYQSLRAVVPFESSNLPSTCAVPSSLNDRPPQATDDSFKRFCNHSLLSSLRRFWAAPQLSCLFVLWCCALLLAYMNIVPYPAIEDLAVRTS